MSQILLIVEIPETDSSGSFSDSQYPAQWVKFMQEVGKLTPPKGFKQLHEGSWMLPAAGALTFVAAVSTLANSQKFPYSAMLIQGEVEQLFIKERPPINISPALLAGMGR